MELWQRPDETDEERIRRAAQAEVSRRLGDIGIGLAAVGFIFMLLISTFTWAWIAMLISFGAALFVGYYSQKTDRSSN